MAHEIERILDEVKQADGTQRPRDLIEKMTNDRRERRRLQQALQIAFDRGILRLNEDMKLEYKARRTAQAA